MKEGCGKMKIRDVNENENSFMFAYCGEHYLCEDCKKKHWKSK
jgi:hypothetical protein